MRISSETLANQAETTGFRPDMLEKVALLLQLLGADYIAREKPAPTPLVPSQPFAGIRQLQRWRLLVNDTVESDV